MKRIAFALAGVLLAAGSVQAQTAVTEQNYRELEKPQNTSVDEGQVEVREFFSYLCPHCYTFEPLTSKWLENAPEEVKLVRTPVVFNESWKDLAQAYYVAETLGVVDQIHEPLFEAIHEEKKQFKDKEALAEFFAEHGVSEEKFLDTWDSFPVDMKMRRGARITQQYRIMSTPSVAVGGKYVVETRSAGGQDGMIRVLDHLVQKELEKGSQAASAE